MAMGMKVDVITRETIKPSSPTPLHLRCYKLSLFDQMVPAIDSSLVLFYPFDGNGDHVMKSSERSQCLKKSLSETLTRFYPLAGRLNENVSVDCNDDGVDYLEARVNCRLTDILGQPEADVQLLFVPSQMESTQADRGRLLLVQANFFECGGLAVGVRISHKLTDATKLSAFIKGWAAISANSSEVVFPEFNMASLFPPRDISSKKLPAAGLAKCNCISRRFVFDASKIAALKAKATGAGEWQPMRVEAVSTLIWKCAMNASRSKWESKRLSVLAQTVNLRKWIMPSVPEYSLGNLVTHFVVETMESEIELNRLVGLIRKGNAEFSDKYGKKLQGDYGAVFEAYREIANLSRSKDVDFYCFSSLCGMSYYEADFGWGKPAWVVFPSTTFNNFILLMDTRDGNGIEAWVILSEADMALFERDEELLTFASPNPSVLNMALSPSSVGMCRLPDQSIYARL